VGAQVIAITLRLVSPQVACLDRDLAADMPAESEIDAALLEAMNRSLALIIQIDDKRERSPGTIRIASWRLALQSLTGVLPKHATIVG
jgi:hypothetical protein